MYSVKMRLVLNRSNPAASGWSNSQGSVKLICPCWVLAPARIRRPSCQPRPRKLFWEMSRVPTKLSTEE